MPQASRIAVVHDFREILEELVHCFAGSGSQVFPTTDPLAAVDIINRYAPQILLTRADFGPDKLASSVLAGMLKLRRADATVLFLAHTPSEALVSQGSYLLTFPISRSRLLQAIDLAMLGPAMPLSPPETA